MLLFDGFMPESMALWSRTTHVSRQTLNGYEIEVPLGWNISGQKDSVSLLKVRGQVRSYLFGSSGETIDFIAIQAAHNPVNYRNSLTVLERIHWKVGKSEERSVAGKKMICMHASPPDYPYMLNIFCVPDGSTDGLSISYSGDTEHVPEFFAILDNVKKTN